MISDSHNFGAETGGLNIEPPTPPVPAMGQEPSCPDRQHAISATESASTAPCFFAGKPDTGSIEPGELQPGDRVNPAAPDSYAGVGPVQSLHPIGGSRARYSAAAAFSEDDFKTAAHRRNVIEAFRALKLTASGSLSNKKAARRVGEPYLTIYRWMKLFDAYGFDGLIPNHKNSGRKRKHQFTDEEADAIRANKLLNNRDKDSGSTPLAIRRTIAEGGLRPETAEALLARAAAGQAAVTPAMANDLHISPIITRTFRNQRNAWLGFNSSPGSLMMTRDEMTGEERLIQPGEACTVDDGTKNFICTVPMEKPGDKCWENFKVVVGRWQILLLVDHRSYFIMGINHTARPKGGYRAEDLQSVLHIGFKQHGRPRRIYLEKGISKADLLHHTLDLAGVKYKHVNSPHQKVVEFVFNSLWSRLSFLPGQVGRTRGEESQVDAILESCKRGVTDPRKYFLSLDTVLKELRKVCEEWNAHLVKSDLYGNWVPQDFFTAESPKHMRELDPSEEWIFSPTVADNNGKGYLIRSQNIRTSFLVMPGYSWRFDFEAPWLCEYVNARVRLHYNAFEPECPAKIVLQEKFHGEAAGTVLGDAEQINWLTRHNRRLFGINETEDIGLIRTRMNAQALRRNAFSIRPDGKPGLQKHDARNGAGAAATATNYPTPAPLAGSVERPMLRQRATGVSENEFERQAARLEREESQRQSIKVETYDE